MPKEMKEVILDDYDLEVAVDVSPSGDCFEVSVCTEITAKWNGDDDTPVEIVAIVAKDDLLVECGGYAANIFDEGANLTDSFGGHFEDIYLEDAVRDEYATLYDTEDES